MLARRHCLVFDFLHLFLSAGRWEGDEIGEEGREGSKENEGIPVDEELRHMDDSQDD